MKRGPCSPRYTRVSRDGARGGVRERASSFAAQGEGWEVPSETMEGDGDNGRHRPSTFALSTLCAMLREVSLFILHLLCSSLLRGGGCTLTACNPCWIGRGRTRARGTIWRRRR